MDDLQGGMTVEAARRRLAQAFRERELDTPELDARLLVGHALGLDHAALAATPGRMLSPADMHAVDALLARRMAREPVARILGCKEFWGLPLRLNAETLVPRPETETVIEAALDALDRSQGRNHAFRLADLGTGSGALALALLVELPQALAAGTDVNPTALGCARDNAAALGLDARALFIACDYGSALKGPLDLIVSNPPYVPHAEIATLPPEVRDFDPRRALDGGPDGLDGYRAIAADARRLLAPHGILVVELGVGSTDAVNALFIGAGLAPHGPARHDLAGVPRALVVKHLP